MYTSIGEPIPRELQSLFLSFVDEKTLARCSRVSRLWNKLSESDSLWKALFPGIEILAQSTNFKAYIQTRHLKKVHSMHELLSRVQNFIHETNNSHYIFNCIFPFHPDAKFKITAKYRVNWDRNADLLEEYIMVGDHALCHDKPGKGYCSTRLAQFTYRCIAEECLSQALRIISPLALRPAGHPLLQEFDGMLQAI